MVCWISGNCFICSTQETDLRAIRQASRRSCKAALYNSQQSPSVRSSVVT